MCLPIDMQDLTTDCWEGKTGNVSFHFKVKQKKKLSFKMYNVQHQGCAYQSHMSPSLSVGVRPEGQDAGPQLSVLTETPWL